jgi:hypothetical protein
VLFYSSNVPLVLTPTGMNTRQGTRLKTSRHVRHDYTPSSLAQARSLRKATRVPTSVARRTTAQSLFLGLAPVSFDLRVGFSTRHCAIVVTVLGTGSALSRGFRARIAPRPRSRRDVELDEEFVLKGV